MFLHGKYLGNYGASDLNSSRVYLSYLLFPVILCSGSSAAHVASGEKNSWENQWELPLLQLCEATLQFSLLPAGRPLSVENSRHR